MLLANKVFIHITTILKLYMDIFLLGGGKGLCGLIMHIYFYLGSCNLSGIVEYRVENKLKRRLIILLFFLRRRRFP